jgi:hypothetical protein
LNTRKERKKMKHAIQILCLSGLLMVLSVPGNLEASLNQIYCIYCGKEAVSPEKFCAFCGKRLPKAVALAIEKTETAGCVKTSRVFVKDEYLDGKSDGRHCAKGNAVWFMGGCLGGALYVLPGTLVALTAYSVNPSAPREHVDRKSLNYKMGFKKGYAAETKRKNGRWALAGCFTSLALLAFAGAM